MTTIFLLIIALHNGLGPDMSFAFHKKAECESLGNDLSKISGNQMSGWECKEIVLLSK